MAQASFRKDYSASLGDKADRVKEVERYDHRMKTKMTRAFVINARDKNSSSSYMQGVQWIEKTKSTKKRLAQHRQAQPVYETNMVRSRSTCSKQEQMVSTYDTMHL